VDQEKTIQLDRPSTGELRTGLINFRTGKASSGTYRRPDNIEVGEQFYIKVQQSGPRHPLVVYDKSRQCQFIIKPEDKGFHELYGKVLQQTASNGTKTYLKASFDASGNCTVYLGTSTLRTW
jgi:hypothetical protein